MADQTKIEWSDATWNIITGCSIKSPGCKNCYAMKLAGSRLKDHPSRQGLTEEVNGNIVWTGEVRFNEDWLDQPMRWSKPRMIFVCAHGDLFHEKVEDAWLDLIFGVMALCPHHIFQVLTKRSDEMRGYCSELGNPDRILKIGGALEEFFGDQVREEEIVDALRRLRQGWLPNVWLGVSAEDQVSADERIADLLSIPAAVHWVSYEPATGPIDFTRLACDLGGHEALGYRLDALAGYIVAEGGRIVTDAQGKLDWIVAGGESGPGARPAHPDWFLHCRDQCMATGTAFLFKQWGNWRRRPIAEGERIPLPGPKDKKLQFIAHDGSRTSAGQGVLMERVNKGTAGRTLDGKIWDQFPRSVAAIGPGHIDQGAEVVR